MTITEQQHREQMRQPEKQPIVLAGLCSKTSRYQIVITGDFGSREISNLMKLLNIHLEWAIEDEEQPSPSETALEAT